MNKFRIDHILKYDGQDVAQYAVYGRTFEEAIESAILLTGPHTQDGAQAIVVKVGAWCNTRQTYIDVSDHFAMVESATSAAAGHFKDSSGLN